MNCMDRGNEVCGDHQNGSEVLPKISFDTLLNFISFTVIASLLEA